MYETKEYRRTLNDGSRISTFRRDVVSADVLTVEAGTNGYQGGDSGHGSRTYFRISGNGTADMQVTRHAEDDFSVTLGGDCELETMIRALKFITKVLEDESEEVYD